jgi:hypothetical protein
VEHQSQHRHPDCDCSDRQHRQPGSGDVQPHNAAFDLRFINREMRLSGLPVLTRPVYCTMKGYRALELGGSASLGAVNCCSRRGNSITMQSPMSLEQDSASTE